MLVERNVDQILVPAGMTGKWQPLDVMVNRLLKAYYKADNTSFGKKSKQKRNLDT